MYNPLSISSPSFISRPSNSANGSLRLIALAICLALSAMAGIAHAAPTAYEPFDYAAGGFDDGTTATGDGFTGTWTCGTPASIVSGLTYTGLPVANNAMQSAGARQFASLSSSLSSGTRWISFLYKSSSGDPGANKNGIYFPNGGTGLFFGFGLQPSSATQGQLGIGSMDTTGSSAAISATTLTLLGLGNYGDTYLVAMEIQFNTSGNNDTVTVYLNPLTNQATPGVAAAGTHSTFDVGTISGVGLNVTGAGTITVDEIRVGDTYADVVDAVITPPNTPTGLNATPGSNSVSLSWTASTGTPTGYNVKRSSASDGPYTTIGATSEPTVTYEDSILGGPTYYYVVSAVNGNGESSNSIPAVATPILAAPAVPTGLAATPGDALVSLSWNASEFATGYTVKRAADPAGPYSTIGGTTDPTVMYDDTTGLANGTTYYYTVSAAGAGGSSPDSSPVSATPFGPLPLVVDIEQGVGITWFASNGVTYQVQWAGEDLGTNTVWNNLGGSLPGNGATNSVFDAAGEPNNVYRVLSIQ